MRAMMLILTHEKTDFDAVAALLGAKKLYPTAVAVLPRSLNRNVQQFLNLYWDSLPFVRADEWKRRSVESVILVDTHTLGNVRGLKGDPKVHVIDHHIGQRQKPGWSYDVEPVGATTTILVEHIMERGLAQSPEEATLLLLGIYEDTGGLTYDSATPRDARAVAAMLDHGAKLNVVRRFLNVALSEQQRQLYDLLLQDVKWVQVEGRPIVVAKAVAPPGFNDEISTIAHRMREILLPEGLFVLVQLGDGVQLVARSSVDEIDASLVARKLGGGGHSRAAAAMIVGGQLESVHRQVCEILPDSVRPTIRVSDLMSLGVETVTASTSIGEVARLMQRHGHEGYPVVDDRRRKIVGLITRRAVDRAISHDMRSHPVSRIMRAGSVTVRPSDTIMRVQELMATEGWGQIPVLPDEGSDPTNGRLPIGIVTRTDLLGALFRSQPERQFRGTRELLSTSFSESLWALVRIIGDSAADLQMPIYFVGGLVRDLLLGKRPADIDIVVEGDAIGLASALSRRIGGDVHGHDRFGTAKWTLGPQVYEAIQAAFVDLQPPRHDYSPVSTESDAGKIDAPQQIDFVSARKEFYKRPTVLPDVEPGSIKLDLHRRDFTINTLAMRLDGEYLGQLLDFYGGRRDLQRGIIRVLHSLSFIDDPTRILRAVRLEQRLGFTIEENTAELLAAALPLLARVTGERIRNEVELSLGESESIKVFRRLDELGVLDQIHRGLRWPPETEAVFSRIPSFEADPIWGEAFQSSPPEFFYFATWLASLENPLAEGVARRLRVRKGTFEGLLAVARLREQLGELPASARISQVVRLLEQFSLRVLLTVRMLDLEPFWNKTLDRYVSQWRNVKLDVTGDDIRARGIPPGPAYAAILDRLRDAMLDGDIVTVADERAMLDELVREHQATA